MNSCGHVLPAVQRIVSGFQCGGFLVWENLTLKFIKKEILKEKIKIKKSKSKNFRLVMLEYKNSGKEKARFPHSPFYQIKVEFCDFMPTK